MDYQISHAMAIELIHVYLEKIYRMKKGQAKSAVKTQMLYDLNQDLRHLVEQMKAKGHNPDELIRGIKEKLEKRYYYEKITVNTDGSARYSSEVDIPNESAIGYAVFGDSQLLHQHVEYIGSTISLPRLRHEPNDFIPPTHETSNNTTEYIAFIRALEYLIENDLQEHSIEIMCDSFLVIDQVSMRAATKAPHLVRLRDYARELISQFDDIQLTLVPREENTYVDELIARLFDKMKKKKERE